MGRLSRGRDGKRIISWQVDGSFIEDLEFGKHSFSFFFFENTLKKHLGDYRVHDKEKEDNGGENELGEARLWDIHMPVRIWL